MSHTEVPERIEGANLWELASLWLEVASTHVLMWIANPTGLHSFQPHVHLYLADRYGRLAIAYRRRSRLLIADRLEGKAKLHFDLGGGDEPPPAAALALGSTQRQLIDADGTVDPTQKDSRLLPFVPKKSTDLLQVNRE
jgi:hypothetical protein